MHAICDATVVVQKVAQNPVVLASYRTLSKDYSVIQSSRLAQQHYGGFNLNSVVEIPNMTTWLFSQN